MISSVVDYSLKVTCCHIFEIQFVNLDQIQVSSLNTLTSCHNTNLFEQHETTEKRFRDYVNLRCVLLNPRFLTKNMDQKWQLSNFLSFKNYYIFFIYTLTNFTFQNLISNFHTIIKFFRQMPQIFLFKLLSSKHTLFPKSNILQ